MLYFYKNKLITVDFIVSSNWDPHTSSNINTIEMVQRKAARFVMNNWSRLSSVTSMINLLEWTTLQVRRQQAKIVMLYRISHSLVAIPFTIPYFIPAAHHGRGHSQKLQQPATRINTYKYSYFPSVVPLWNSLDQSIVGAPTITTFKERLKHHQF